MPLRLRRNRLPFFAGLLVLAASSVIATQAQDQGLVFHWTGKLSPDQLVEIRNVNGNIDAEGSSSDQVEVTAEKSGRNAQSVKIEVVPNSDGVTICAIYPSRDSDSSSDRCSLHHSNNSGSDTGDASVHFTVRLPKNLRFSADNVNGGVTAENLGRAIQAASVNGSIRLSTSAWAQAQTVNGSIHATMGDADWPGTLKLASVNGSVELQMPSDINADIKFSSVNGEMKSEFPLDISNGWPVGHSAKGTLGKGGRKLVVDTVNGNVSLTRSAGTL